MYSFNSKTRKAINLTPIQHDLTCRRLESIQYRKVVWDTVLEAQITGGKTHLRLASEYSGGMNSNNAYYSRLEIP